MLNNFTQHVWKITKLNNCLLSTVFKNTCYFAQILVCKIMGWQVEMSMVPSKDLDRDKSR